MRDTGRSRRKARWLSWPAFLPFVPVVATLLLVSPDGRAWLDREMTRPKPAALLPGITIENPPPSKREGPIVTSIRSGSEAAQDGVAVGDSVVAIDGMAIFTLDQARHYLQKDKADRVELSVVHGSRLRDVRLDREGV